MKAITLHQPWATLIAIGAKRYETRGWITYHRGPLLIHAGKTCYPWQAEPDLAAEVRFALQLAGLDPHRPLPAGVILASCTLVDCLPATQVTPSASERCFGDFTPGHFVWVLEGARQSTHIRASGKMGLWDFPGRLDHHPPLLVP
jgi:hypothetical protein